MTDLPDGVTDAMVEAGARAACDSYFGAGEFDRLDSEQRSVFIMCERAALTAALAGRVVVPREPTLAMINAVDTGGEMFTSPFTSIEGLYSAMIAAATADLSAVVSPGDAT